MPAYDAGQEASLQLHCTTSIENKSSYDELIFSADTALKTFVIGERLLRSAAIYLT